MGLLDKILGKRNSSTNDSSANNISAVSVGKYHIMKNKSTRLWDICTDISQNPPLDKYRWAVDFKTEEEAEKYLKETLQKLKEQQSSMALPFTEQQVNSMLKVEYPTGNPHLIDTMLERPEKFGKEVDRYKNADKNRDYYKKLAQKDGVEVSFNKKEYTDKEIIQKLTEKEFRVLIMLQLDAARGVKTGSEINPKSKENLMIMNNLEDYGLIERFWSDIVFLRPENRAKIPYTGRITQKGLEMAEKIAPRFIKNYSKSTAPKHKPTDKIWYETDLEARGINIFFYIKNIKESDAVQNKREWMNLFIKKGPLIKYFSNSDVTFFNSGQKDWLGVKLFNPDPRFTVTASNAVKVYSELLEEYFKYLEMALDSAKVEYVINGYAMQVRYIPPESPNTVPLSLLERIDFEKLKAVMNLGRYNRIKDFKPPSLPKTV